MGVPHLGRTLPDGSQTTNYLAGSPLQGPAIAKAVQKGGAQTRTGSLGRMPREELPRNPAEQDQFEHASVAVAKHAAGGRPHHEQPGVLSQTSDTKMPSQFAGAGVVVVGAGPTEAEYHNWLRPEAPS